MSKIYIEIIINKILKKVIGLNNKNPYMRYLKKITT